MNLFPPRIVACVGGAGGWRLAVAASNAVHRFAWRIGQSVSTMGSMATASDKELLKLFAAIANGDEAFAMHVLVRAPAVAMMRLVNGATRENPEGFFFERILHGVYAGDTALHVAAAAYRFALLKKLLDLGANASAKNRRGAEPLHYAVDGVPGSPSWNPEEQARIIQQLLAAGADPNAIDKGGVTPLHRAVRNRCANAVRVLLEGGADARRKNKSGSTAMTLAVQTTGRGGSGSTEAKEQQALIVQMLKAPQV